MVSESVSAAVLSVPSCGSRSDARRGGFHDKGSIRGSDFAVNQYLLESVTSNLESLQESVKQIQLQQGPASTDSLFGAFSAFGGNSDVGSGLGNFINVFV